MADEETETAIATTDGCITSSATTTGKAVLTAGAGAARMVAGAQAAKAIGVAARQTLGGMLQERFPQMDEESIGDLTEFLAPVALHFMCTHYGATIPKAPLLLAASEAAMEAQYFLLLHPLIDSLTDALIPIADIGAGLASE